MRQTEACHLFPPQTRIHSEVIATPGQVVKTKVLEPVSFLRLDQTIHVVAICATEKLKQSAAEVRETQNLTAQPLHMATPRPKPISPGSTSNSAPRPESSAAVRPGRRT